MECDPVTIVTMSTLLRPYKCVTAGQEDKDSGSKHQQQQHDQIQRML